MSLLADLPRSVWGYWKFQFDLGHQVIVPELQRKGLFQPGWAVAEVGCGEGGVLMAFLEAGAIQGLGTDIDLHRIEAGRQIASHLGWKLDLAKHNILEDPIPERWCAQYDLVILRDTIEHLQDTKTALQHIAQLLKPGGYLYVSFPPYLSPYGGHQHLLRNLWGKIPYIHLLPDSLFLPLTESGQEPGRSEVRRLRKIRLSPRRLLQTANTLGYSLIYQKHYLIRAAFRYRLGISLPTIDISWLMRLTPELSQFISTESTYAFQWPPKVSSLG